MTTSVANTKPEKKANKMEEDPYANETMRQRNHRLLKTKIQNSLKPKEDDENKYRKISGKVKTGEIFGNLLNTAS